MILSRLISFFLRALQLASAAIVAGIVGAYLHDVNEVDADPADRFVYTIVVASFALLASLILLVPFSASLTVFPLDLLFFLLWIIAFGLAVDFIAPMNCEWGWSWAGRYYTSDSPIDQCQRWKAALAFMFLSAMWWLFSAILALWVVYSARRGPAGERRRWYRSHY
ncbi:marvel domain-containing protein [Kalaharituber pfeilii]|nr:marvel domain-containing protein [Kalaharituber pfeilii]